jgi:CMP-N-acetylneuraminic acid synthetase
MKIIAFIPIRGGSKRIPLKNITNLNGKPLAWWALQAACKCDMIDEVIVATDSDDIVNGLGFIRNSKINLITVPIMDDQCMQEQVMIEYAKENTFNHIVLLQVTSPLTTGCDLTGGINLYLSNGCDSVVSVCRQHRFLWGRTKKNAYPLNYVPTNRPREQDWDGMLVENGAFFITSKAALLESRCRTSGNVSLYEMSEDTYFQVDTFDDLDIIEKLMNNRRITNG